MPTTRRTLTIGLLLLAALWIFTGCEEVDDDSADDDTDDGTMTMGLDDYEVGAQVPMDLAVSNRLRGFVDNRLGDEFSFGVTDDMDIAFQLDDLPALDGTYDEQSEAFEIAILEGLPAGDYTLSLYSASAQAATMGVAPEAEYTLVVAGQ